jgi:AcrR family transcriptional regulator
MSSFEPVVGVGMVERPASPNLGVVSNTAAVASPPDTSRRDRKKQRTRRDIAEAAIELFETQGYAATTVEQIAEAADYAPSTVFRHFAGKEDIIFFDFPDRLDHLREAFARPNHGSAWTTIRQAIIENAIGWELNPSELGARRARLFHEVPALYGRYMAISDDFENEIAKLCADERGVDPNADITCRLIAGAVVAAFRAAWRAQNADGEATLVRHLETALNLLEAGLRPDGD